MIQVFLHKIVAGWLGKLLVGGAAVLTSIRYAGGIYAWIETEKLERPSYVVLRTLPDGVEVRRYDPYIIAETVVVDAVGFQGAGRKGFGPCAGYIFGKNRGRARSGGSGGESEKMAMTAPVRLDDGGSEGRKKTKVSFVIGSKYTLKTAPIPLERNKIKLRQVPAHTLAVRSFSGPPPNDDRVERERRRLLTVLANSDIPIKSEATLVYGYHDPFITPNILRRNEVAVIVEGSV
jgi:SOUL heme-binding protein